MTVSVTEDFAVHAGDVSMSYDPTLRRDTYTIAPPPVSMFDQVFDYLTRQPKSPFTTDIQVRFLGVGFAALCIRWGSYLSSLLNANAPLHATLLKSNKANPRISYLSDSEMMRLNLEISSNIARLGAIYKEDKMAFYDLLMRAYHYLPMPFKTTQPNKDLEDGLVSTYIRTSILRYLHERPEALPELVAAGLLPEGFQGKSIRWERIDLAQADRVLGNYLANHAWRNTGIEDYHAGSEEPEAPLLPDQRRFTERDARRLLKELSENSAVIIRQIELLFSQEGIASPLLNRYAARYPLSAEAVYNSVWFYAYPHLWSLSDSASPVTL